MLVWGAQECGALDFTHLTYSLSTSTRNQSGVSDPHASSGLRPGQAEQQCVYCVHIAVVCTVQLINTWHQAVLSRGFVDYSENGGVEKVGDCSDILIREFRSGLRKIFYLNQYQILDWISFIFNSILLDKCRFERV
jgi:hypothetical protein